MLEPLKKSRLYEEIIKQLQELIRNGSLKPGDKLPPERELGKQLNVSRTAIREALRSMESMGYIESKVGGGTFIRQITFNNVLDPFSDILAQDKKLIIELIDVRLLLEVEIARLAAGRINNEKAEAIDRALSLMDKEIAGGGIGIGGDNAFHAALAEAADNTAMMRILDMCADLLSSTRQATLKIPSQSVKSLADHVAIADAVKAGDTAAAAALMKEHLLKAQKNLEQLQ
jgi:GntR family transcriptional repressor for pyruvate dehydrogenase complex